MIILLYNPHGSDGTNQYSNNHRRGSKQLYNPHGSDGTNHLCFRGLKLQRFITHTVQMELNEIINV